MKFDVSVIIPVLNSEAVLEKCLASIRANITNYSYEIIVVDAGSDDLSMEIAGKYADKLLKGKPRTIDRNTGLNNAAGRIVCFTDSDCIVPSNWINRLVNGLEILHSADSGVAGVGGGNVPFLDNPTAEEIAITKAMRSPLISFKARNTAAYAGSRLVTHNPPLNSAYYKFVLDDVGGFVQQDGYPEDLDLDARITALGYKLFYLSDVNVAHKHKNSIEAFARQMRDFGSKRCRVNRRHKQLSRFYHYGPLALCLMLYSPFFFVPLGLALLNALFITFKNRSLGLLLPTLRLTLDFYRNYGLGEMKAVLEFNQ